MKHNKLLRLLLCVLTLATLCFCLTACMGGGDPGASTPSTNPCANGHSVDEWYTVTEATCTATGLKRGYCPACQEQIEEEIPATGHTEVTEPAVSATCEEEGKTEKVYCSVCDTVITESTVIPGGHVKGELEEVYAPSLYESSTGWAIFDCLNCTDHYEVKLPYLGDESWSMELVGEEEIYTCQVEGQTISVSLSLFSFSEEGNAYSGFYCTVTGYRGNSVSPAIPATYKDYPVTRIGDSVFEDNTTITSIVIPDSITEIGAKAFKNCTNLTSVTLPEALTEIGDSAFYNCAKIEAIDFPESLTDIGASAFAACTSLTALEIPTSVCAINNDAFSGCTGLKTVSYAEPITQEESGIDVGNAVFANCSELTSFSLPMGIYGSGRGVLSNCNKLKYLEVTELNVDGLVRLGNLFSLSNGDNPASLAPASLKELVLHCKVYSRTLYGAANLEKITLYSTVEENNYNAFEGCDSLQELHFIGSDFAAADVLPALTTVTFTDVESVAGFRECPNLTDVSFTNVEKVNGGAFSNCAKLENLTFTGTLGFVGQSAFDNCPSLETTVYGGGTYVGDEANPYKILISMALEEGVTEFAFAEGTEHNAAAINAYSPTKVTVPASLKSSAWTFGSNVSEIVYGGTANDWCAINFGYNPVFEAVNATLTLKDGVLSSEVTELVIGEHVQKLSNLTTAGFTGVTTVTLHKGITEMYDAFTDALVNVYYDGTVQDWALINFYYDDVKSNPMYYAEHLFFKNAEGEYYEAVDLIFTDGFNLGNYQFAGMENLNSIVLGDGYYSIRENAFEGTPVKYIFFEGNADSWSYISYSDYYSENFDVYFYQETEPTDADALYWHYDEDGAPTPWSEPATPEDPSDPEQPGDSSFDASTLIGKTFTYSSTVVTVSEQYWGMILTLKEAGMLEEMGYDALTLEMMQNSNTKAEFEENLLALSQQTGVGSSLTFGEGTLTYSLNGTTVQTLTLHEGDGYVYTFLPDGTKPKYYLDEQNRLCEDRSDEDITIIHYYTEVTE